MEMEKDQGSHIDPLTCQVTNFAIKDCSPLLFCSRLPVHQLLCDTPAAPREPRGPPPHPAEGLRGRPRRPGGSQQRGIRGGSGSSGGGRVGGGSGGGRRQLAYRVLQGSWFELRLSLRTPHY